MSAIFTEKSFSEIALPKNSNLINYSVLQEFYSATPFRSFSVKYVAEGSELYSVNGNKYVIKKQEYLLANQFSEGFVLVDSSKPVTGICIDVAPEILSEVVASFLEPGTSVSDPELDAFFNSTSFLENKYNASQTNLGSFLRRVESTLYKDNSVKNGLDKDFYYSLSEKIIMDHLPVMRQMKSIKALKPETKKDLLRKVLRAKAIMDECFFNPLSIGSIALDCGISEYHFFRLFKAVFSVSPHQYIIRKRLAYAKKLKEEGASVSQMAICSGFPDLQSFSKAYKKQFGVPPSGISFKKFS